MPHFSIEYSANLDAAVDIAEICELVRKAAVETGIFPLGGIRVRAIRCEHYAIADGASRLRLSGHAAAPWRRTRPRRAPEGGRAYFPRTVRSSRAAVRRRGRFALSFDMQINDKDMSWKRNTIHDALKAEAVHG